MVDPSVPSADLIITSTEEEEEQGCNSYHHPYYCMRSPCISRSVNRSATSSYIIREDRMQPCILQRELKSSCLSFLFQVLKLASTTHLPRHTDSAQQTLRNHSSHYNKNTPTRQNAPLNLPSLSINRPPLNPVDNRPHHRLLRPSYRRPRRDSLHPNPRRKLHPVRPRRRDRIRHNASRKLLPWNFGNVHGRDIDWTW
jgi:hypothetical protein